MSVGVDPRRAMQQRSQPQAGSGRSPQPETASVPGFAALDLTKTRLALADDELAWLENGMFLGRGVIAVPLYNGAAGASLNATSLVKESYGCALTYGTYTAPHPVAIVVFEDGSAKMRDYYLDAPVDITIGPAGTFSASPLRTGITMWQDGPVLFLDEGEGYLSWNGATLTVIDNTKKGPALAVFEGHAWLRTAPRTITYTAPNTYNNFAAGDGAGSFKITDDAFQGAVYQMVSTVEQLWILGASSIDALGNVATSGGVTTFAVTNAVTSLGTTFPDTVLGYYRSVTFYTGYSVHSLLGVTPQKLSAKLDRLFGAIGPLITAGPRVGVQELNGVTVLCFLVQFTDAATDATRSMILGFQEGKWFLTRTPDLSGNQVVDLVTLTIHAVPEVYGVDRSGRMYRVFARPDDPPQGTMTVSSKLYDRGAPVMGMQATKIGFDLSAPSTTTVVPITVTLVTEATSVSSLVQEKFNPLRDSPLGFKYALYRRNAPIIGQRIGWTLQVPCRYGVTLEAAHLESAPTGEDGWDLVDPAVTAWLFTGLASKRFSFTGDAAAPFSWLG